MIGFHVSFLFLFYSCSVSFSYFQVQFLQRSKYCVIKT